MAFFRFSGNPEPYLKRQRNDPADTNAIDLNIVLQSKK